MSAPLLPLLAAALWRCRDGASRAALAIVVDDDDAARALAEDGGAFLPGAPVGYLPSRGALYGSGLEPAAAPRRRALSRAGTRSTAGGLVAVSADALIERIPAPATAAAAGRAASGATSSGFDELVEPLVEAGYERVDTVEERGEVSVRGGLVDVFPTTGREPLRIELFGDEVERLSAFSVFTQRSLRELDQRRGLSGRRARRPGAAAGATTTRRPFPTGLVSLPPELAQRAGVVVWNPET